jgi:shikimate dehydrogenase
VVTGCDDSKLERLLPKIDLLVNATSLGMGGPEERSPLPDGLLLSGGTRVIDMVYGHPTRLAAQAAAAGCEYSDGIEMLVRQGAAAFTLWTGLEPDLEVMRCACRSRLAKEQVCFAS